MPQISALAIGVYFCLFLSGPKNDYVILGPPLIRKPFFVGLYGTFFAEHWLAKFEFVNGVLTY